MYSSCSGCQRVDRDAQRSQLEAGDLSVDFRRQQVNARLKLPLFFTRYSTDSAWFAKLISITLAGCPSAAARLIKRPSPRTITLRAAAFDFVLLNERTHRLPARPPFRSSATRFSSRSKCPLLQTIAPSFIFAKCWPIDNVSIAGDRNEDIANRSTLQPSA